MSDVFQKANDAISINLQSINDKIMKLEDEEEVSLEFPIDGVDDGRLVVTVGLKKSRVNIKNNLQASRLINGEQEVSISRQNIPIYYPQDIDIKIGVYYGVGYFYLQTAGTFMHGIGPNGYAIVNSYSGSCTPSAFFPYSGSTERCEHEFLDQSWVKSYNVASYKMFPWPVAYRGFITVSMYGTGNFTIDRAEFLPG